MHAYLLITENQNAAREKVREILGKEKLIVEFKIEKISDTKELIAQTNIALSQTVYFLYDFDDASVEAQNALLKRLEEPQENLFFALVARKEDKVLPTIASRCQVQRIIVKKTTDEEVLFSAEFFESDINEKLSIISKITKREDAVPLLEKLIIGGDKTKHLNGIKQADMALSRINQNGNPTLQLANFVVSLSLQ